MVFKQRLLKLNKFEQQPSVVVPPSVLSVFPIIVCFLNYCLKKKSQCFAVIWDLRWVFWRDYLYLQRHKFDLVNLRHLQFKIINFISYWWLGVASGSFSSDWLPLTNNTFNQLVAEVLRTRDEHIRVVPSLCQPTEQPEA